MVTDVVDDVGRLGSGPGRSRDEHPGRGPAGAAADGPGATGATGRDGAGAAGWGRTDAGGARGVPAGGPGADGPVAVGSGAVGASGGDSGAGGADGAGGEDATLAAIVVTTSVLGVVRLIAAALAVPTLLTRPVTPGTLLAVALPLAAAGLLVRCPAALTATATRRVLLLAADLAVGVTVVAAGGLGVPALGQSLGTAALAAALWGVPGVVLGAAGGMVASVAVALIPTMGFAARLPLGVVVSIPTAYALVALVAALVRHLHREQVLLRQSLRQATWQAAQAAERARLARELHDSLAKTLFGIGLTARAVQAGADRPAVVGELAEDIAVAADEATAQARAMIAGLRETSSPDLAGAIRTTVGAWARSGPAAVETDLHLVPEPAPEVRRELVAVLGEALSNVRRHAGATRVRVGLVADGRVVRLTVQDDGRGLAVPASAAELAPTGRFGLLGMTERLQEIGGTLTVRSAAGAGTEVVAEVPVDPRERA